MRVHRTATSIVESLQPIRRAFTLATMGLWKPCIEGGFDGDDDRGVLVKWTSQKADSRVLEDEGGEAGQFVGPPSLVAVTGVGRESDHQVDKAANAVRDIIRMSAEAMTIARYGVPVPVPPMSTTMSVSVKKMLLASSRRFSRSKVDVRRSLQTM